MDEALALWRGEPFAALDTPWINAVRDTLIAQRLAVELDRNDIALDRGRHAELVAGLFTAAAADPLDEHRPGYAQALGNLGWLQVMAGEHEAALVSGRAAVVLLEDLGDRFAQAATG